MKEKIWKFQINFKILNCINKKEIRILKILLKLIDNLKKIIKLLWKKTFLRKKHQKYQKINQINARRKKIKN